MAYEIVLDNDRYKIIDKGGFPNGNTVTPNLAENESKIILIVAKDCPLKESCIYLDYRVTSICKYLGFISQINETIPCRHNDTFVERELEFYKTDPDCEREHIKEVVIPLELGRKPDKSHAYVVCEK